MKSNWKFKIAFGMILYLALAQYLPGQTVPNQGIESITAEEMKNHVFFLASDEMKGRDTPSPELDSCANYIAKEFASYGLQPIAPKQSYFQTFHVLRTHLGQPNQFIVTKKGQIDTFAIKQDFVPLYITANRKISAPVLFAGYGITAPEYNYDDYQNIDAKGKIVLVFTDEPQENDSSSVFEGTQNTDFSKLSHKVENAIDHGASGLILVNNPGKRFLKPPNFWPSLMRNAPKDAVPLTLEQKAEYKIVCTQIGKNLFDQLMIGSKLSPAEILQQIDETLTPRSFDLAGIQVTMETNLDAEYFNTQNVAGFLEGGDPKFKHDVIVIGAHYDHVGVQHDSIFNGADDNASGTAGLMEVAEAFSESPEKPKRSILFLAFAGEEKGLFGSRYYTENPLIPLDSTVAMLNMDMISRNDSNEIAIVGAKSSPDLKAIDEKADESLGVKLDYGQDSFFRQSDHYSFYRQNIPVLFYFSKVTPDLHKPSDDPEKIIPEKMARVGRLVFATAWMVANREERPNFVRFQ